MTSPGGADAPDSVEVLGRLGPDGPASFVLYTGGTFGMGVHDDVRRLIHEDLAGELSGHG